jgi:hypothetical protein
MSMDRKGRQTSVRHRDAPVQIIPLGQSTCGIYMLADAFPAYYIGQSYNVHSRIWRHVFEPPGEMAPIQAGCILMGCPRKLLIFQERRFQVAAIELGLMLANSVRGLGRYQGLEIEKARLLQGVQLFQN